MPIENVVIREISQDDDFEAIERLFYETNFAKVKEILEKQKVYYRKENWKKIMFPNSENEGRAILRTLKTKGFIALKTGIVKAMITVGLSPTSHNGFIEYGYADGYDSYIGELLNCVCKTVKDYGGNRLYKTTGMQLGQVRNDDITFWERHGMIADQFYHVFVQHNDLLNWTIPDNLDISGIEPTSQIDIQKIVNILEQDQEYFLAEDFRSEYPNQTPDHVFLTLRDTQLNEIAAISYYKVWERKDALVALSFGIHIRPKFDLSRNDIRRLIQATLASMKQLDVTAAWSRISSRNFQLLLELFREGFELPVTNTALLIKNV